MWLWPRTDRRCGDRHNLSRVMKWSNDDQTRGHRRLGHRRPSSDTRRGCEAGQAWHGRSDMTAQIRFRSWKVNYLMVNNWPLSNNQNGDPLSFNMLKMLIMAVILTHFVNRPFSLHTTGSADGSCSSQRQRQSPQSLYLWKIQHFWNIHFQIFASCWPAAGASEAVYFKHAIWIIIASPLQLLSQIVHWPLPITCSSLLVIWVWPYTKKINIFQFTNLIFSSILLGIMFTIRSQNLGVRTNYCRNLKS